MNDEAKAQGDGIVKREGRMGALASQSLPLDRNPAAIYLASLSATGRRSMESKLRRASGILGYPEVLEAPWQDLRFQHVMAVRTRLREVGLAPSTINCTLAALKGVAKAAFNLGLMGAEEYQRIKGINAVRGSREVAGRLITRKELLALFRACVRDPSPAGVRDAAMLSLLYGCGLRRSEVATLDLADLNIAEDRESAELLVRGKGDKERTVYLNSNGVLYLVRWLALRGREPGPLFCSVNKGGRIALRRMTAQAIYCRLIKRGRQGGLEAFSPHDLRRTFISDLLDAGADIATVQDMAGHANVSTTARYDRRGEERKRRAAGMLHVPYREPAMQSLE